MLKRKQIIGLAAAAVSACALIAAQATAAFAEEEPDYDAMLRQKLEERAKYLEEFGDEDPEPEEIDYTDLDPEYAKIVTLFGDVNFDKLLGVSDVVQLQRYLLGEADALGNWFNADLNQDGVINVLDFTLLKQQICGNAPQKGGSLAVNLVNVMTGEPIDGGYMHMFCVYDNTWSYDVRTWKNTAENVAYFSGLPNDPKYVYYIDVTDLPNGYGNILGNCGQQYNFFFAEGETSKVLNVRLASNEDEQNPNVVISQMDWAMDMNILEYSYNYGWVSIEDMEGNTYYQRVDGKGCRLPDGEYVAKIHPYADIWDDYPTCPVDPDSDFAEYIRTIHPDVVFTDKSEGIPFTVTDGVADKEITFDFGPKPGVSNSITVSCIDNATGEPLEGVEISLIEAPDTYAKKIATWISDETGTHTVGNLFHTGYGFDNRAYKICVESLPAGYEGGFEEYCCFGYVYDYSQEFTYYFSEADAPKRISADAVRYEDGTVLDGAATFEVYRINAGDITNLEKIYNGVQTGEKFALLDGEYCACLDVRTLAQEGYSGIDLLGTENADIAAQFNQNEFIGNTVFIRFTVQDGLPDRELKFYLRTAVPSENE